MTRRTKYLDVIFLMSIWAAYESSANCPIDFVIPHGYYNVTTNGAILLFGCEKGFILYGPRGAQCIDDAWSSQPPHCITNGCQKVESSDEMHVEVKYEGAQLSFRCTAGFELEGNDSIHCNGSHWSVQIPKCVEKRDSLSCDFEKEDLCGWSLDQEGDFNWTWQTGTTPTARTGPNYDHTLGPTGKGHYLFIETSLPRMNGDQAILKSPFYMPDVSGQCFSFWYHSNGKGLLSRLEVFVWNEGQEIEDLTPRFALNENTGPDWQNETFYIPLLNTPFKIIFVGTRLGGSYHDIAIDDVSLGPCPVPVRDVIHRCFWTVLGPMGHCLHIFVQAHNATTAPLVLQRSDVECQTTSLKIFVPKNLVPGNGTVTWRDSACVVYSNGTHFVDSVGLRDCGTTLTLEADSVVFENDLILHKNGTQMQNGNNIVTYGSDYEFAIPVKCVYPRNSNISTSYIPIVQQVRIMERRNGQLDLTMRQYEAEDYRHPVPFNAYPRQVPLNNDIFIRLAMENNVTGLGLSADNCFATSTPSPVDQNWYQLISSGCPVNNAKIHPSGINDVKFSFHAFNFRLNTSGIVYVHCQVSVCLDTDPACVVGCMTRKKRSASAREGAITSNLISTGPFILAADEGGEAMSTVVAAVSITIAVIATVVAIIGWTRKSKKGADS